MGNSVIVVTLAWEGNVLAVTARHPDALSNVKLVQYGGAAVSVAEADPFHQAVKDDHLWQWNGGEL